MNQLHAFVVLIDPGHGGEDTGAKSTVIKNKKMHTFQEKDLALSLATLIAKELRKYKNVSVYLTRRRDQTIELSERAEIAEKVKADLFVSIHLNASMNSRSHGIETYYLNNHKSAAVKKIEAVENKNVDGTTAEINQILADLVVTRMAPESKLFAESIHQEITGKVMKKFKMKDRGVKPALFYVLALSKRPSVLLEVGFMSNSTEMKKLMKKSFQQDYAKAVATGIASYLKKKSKGKVYLF